MFHPVSLGITGGSKTANMDYEPMTIYVVDDHQPMRTSLEALLSSAGFAAASFAGGEQFLEAVEQLDPGILLTDLRMSGINGLDLIASLKEAHRDFPAIIMTAHGDVDAAVRALRLGARDFIQKPFREAELVAVLQRETEALRSSIASDALRRSARRKMARLSARELEVVRGLAEGKTNKSIAHDLSLSVRTVEMHRSRAMDRIGCRNIAELMAIAFQGELAPQAGRVPPS